MDCDLYKYKNYSRLMLVILRKQQFLNKIKREYENGFNITLFENFLKILITGNTSKCLQSQSLNFRML